jgi:hypothetical protein
MKKIGSATMKLVNGKTLEYAATVTSIVIVRDYKMFNFVIFFKCCWEIFKEDLKN